MNVTPSTGETLTFPVMLRDLTQFGVVYQVRVADVQKLLPSDLVPFDTGYGLTKMYVYWLRAGDSDFGPFSEVAVTFSVYEPYYGGEAAHYFANPITTDKAQKVGYEVWGHPTRLANIDIEHNGDTASCVLTMDGEFVLAIRSKHGPTKACRAEGLVSTPAPVGSNSRSNLYRYSQTSPACAFVDKPTDISIELGGSQLAQQILSLMVDDAPIHSFYYSNSTMLSGPKFSELSKLNH